MNRITRMAKDMDEPCVVCGKAPDDGGWAIASTGVICYACQMDEWRKMMQSYEAMIEVVQKGMAKD